MGGTHEASPRRLPGPPRRVSPGAGRRAGLTSTPRSRRSWPGAASTATPGRTRRGSSTCRGEPRPCEGGESGPAIVPGKPEREPALGARRGRRDAPEDRRCPRPRRPSLRDWIAAGAAWGTDPIDPFRTTTDRRAGRDWWSLQPVGRPDAARRPRRRRGPRTPIDAFVLQRLEAAGLTPAPRGRPADADPPPLLRPDRPAADARGGRRRSSADDSARRLRAAGRPPLASPHYGVRWARHWLDLARFGESNGFEYDEFRPERLALSRLGRRRPQPRPALRRVRPPAARRRRAPARRPRRPSRRPASSSPGPYDTVGQNQQSEAMRRRRPPGRAGRPRRHRRPDVPRPDGPLRPLPRPQVRPDPPGRLLPARLRPRRRPPRRARPRRRSTRPSAAAQRRIARPAAPVAAIEAPARARSCRGATAAAEPAPTPLAALGLRPRARATGSARCTRTLQGGARLDRRGPPARRQDRLRRHAAAGRGPEGEDARGLGPARRPRPARRRRRSACRRSTAASSTPSSSASASRAAGWPAARASAATQSFGGAAETEADQRPVHVAIAYAEDGTIRAYRDGQPYGEPYKSPGPVDLPGR